MSEAVRSEESKYCKVCKENKPLSAFYHHLRKDTGRIRIESFCTKCKADKWKAYAQANPDQIKARHAKSRAKAYAREKEIPATKICRTCNAEKKSSEFRKANQNLDGLQNDCTACVTIQQAEYRKENRDRLIKAKLERYHSGGKIAQLSRAKEYRKKNPEKMKERKLKLYDMPLEEYYNRLRAQNETCFICKHPETMIDKRTGKVKDLSVDHNHISGENRALLCTRCNTMLGYSRESTDPHRALEIMKAGLEYITKNPVFDPHKKIYT